MAPIIISDPGAETSLSVEPDDGILEALEEAIDAFLENMDAKAADELTDSLASTGFARGNVEAAAAMEQLLLTTLVPKNKCLRIQGLAGERAAELNGRIGVLLKQEPGCDPAISLVPADVHPAEWITVRVAKLRPASMGELQQAVVAAIQNGQMRSFEDLLRRPDAPTASASPAAAVPAPAATHASGGRGQKKKGKNRGGS